MSLIFKSPGIKSQEINLSQYARSVSTCIVGMVGAATKGPIGVPTHCSSVNDYISKFGEPIADDYGSIAAVLFLERGSELYYTRVAEAAAHKASYTTALVNSYGEEVASFVTFNYSDEGTSGNKYSLKITDGTGATESTIVVLKDNKAVAQQKINLIPGDKYFLGNFSYDGITVSLEAPITDFKATLTNPTPLDGDTFTLTFNRPLYKKVESVLTAIADAESCSSFITVYTALGAASTTTVTSAAYDLETRSITITLSGVPATGSYIKLANLFDASGNGYFSQKAEYVEASTTWTLANYAFRRLLATTGIVNMSGGHNGTPVQDSTIVTGLKVFASADDLDINLLTAPGRTTDTILTEIKTIVEARKDCLAIVDTPFGLTPQEAVDFHNGASGEDDAPAAPIDSSYMAMFYPWGRLDLSTFNSELSYMYVPPSCFVPAVFAYNDSVAYAWFAPAGLRRGSVDRVVELELNLSEEERDLLYGDDNCINPIINYKRQGIVIWGQKTMTREASAVDRINVRRMLSIVIKTISTSSAKVLFEQNDKYTWSNWIAMVTPVLQNIKDLRGLYDYSVVMDSTTVTEANIDKNEMPGVVYLKPTKVAEFIPLQFVLTSTGATFTV